MGHQYHHECLDWGAVWPCESGCLIRPGLCDLDVYDVVTANEVFLTSTSLCICGVRSVNSHTIGDGKVPGPITKRLTDAYVALVGTNFMAQYLPAWADAPRVRT